MIRRIVTLPGVVDELVREAAGADESYSATVARLIEAGAKALRSKRRPAWIGSGEGPEDLGLRAEEYLRESVRSR